MLLVGFFVWFVFPDHIYQEVSLRDSTEVVLNINLQNFWTWGAWCFLDKGSLAEQVQIYIKD